jgi:uncharacterized small protein (DUF1192 family)
MMMTMKQVATMSESKGGRKEVLTRELADRIVKFIERLPDANVEITWENVILHLKKKFGIEFRRNVLSQKEWGGRKLIAEAFSTSKSVKRRMTRDQAPKYATSSRAVLQKRVAELEAKVIGLQEELERTRAQQYDELDLFRVRRKDLRKLVEESQGRRP